MYIIYLQIFSLPAIQCKWQFLQKCINFVEQRLKFSQFKGNMIPQIDKKEKFMKQEIRNLLTHIEHLRKENTKLKRHS